MATHHSPSEPPDGYSAPASQRGAVEAVPVWAQQLVYWLDTAIRVPGTNITIGLDAILGFLLPTAGDALTALSALSLFSLAVRYRVPKVVIAKMLVNVAVDVLIGAIPILGDAFDVLWRSNKKNLELIERYRTMPGAPAKPGDYVIVALAFVVLLALLALPFVVAAFVVGAVVKYW
jgi:hypothetical protein